MAQIRVAMLQVPDNTSEIFVVSLSVLHNPSLKSCPKVSAVFGLKPNIFLLLAVAPTITSDDQGLIVLGTA